MTAYSRRRLLALGGAVTAGALAGCSGAGNTAETPEAESTPDEASGSILRSVSLKNLDDEARTVDVLVQQGETTPYWETHELSAMGGDGDSSLTLDSGWSTDPGEFQLAVRLSEGDTRASVSSTELPDRDCLDLVVLISQDGELSLLRNVSGDDCATDAGGNSSEP